MVGRHQNREMLSSAMNRDSSSLEMMGDLLFDVDLEMHTRITVFAQLRSMEVHGVGLYEQEGHGQTQKSFWPPLRQRIRHSFERGSAG